MLVSKSFHIIFPLFLVVGFLSVPLSANAQTYKCVCGGGSEPGITRSDQALCDTACFAYCQSLIPAEGGSCVLDTSTRLNNPLGSTDVKLILGGVIGKGLGIIGSIALVLFIYGGFVWMTAGGNQQRVTTGRNILIWATVGLLVIFSSYAILTFIFGALK